MAWPSDRPSPPPPGSRRPDGTTCCRQNVSSGQRLSPYNKSVSILQTESLLRKCQAGCQKGAAAGCDAPRERVGILIRDDRHLRVRRPHHTPPHPHAPNIRHRRLEILERGWGADDVLAVAATADGDGADRARRDRAHLKAAQTLQAPHHHRLGCFHL